MKLLSKLSIIGLSLTIFGCNSNLNNSLINNIPYHQNNIAENTITAQSVSDELIIKLNPNVSPTEYATKNNLKHVMKIGLNMHLFKGKANLNNLKKDNSVKWIEKNTLIKLPVLNTKEVNLNNIRRNSFPNDPLYPAQYGPQITGIEKVWNKQKGSKDVIVAVIDSGVDAQHPEFQGQLVSGWDVTKDEPGPGGDIDGYGHGTHVAGVIGAKLNNGIGIAGAAPGCKIMPVRIFNDWGHSASGYAAAAIIWAVDNGAKIINASWGSPLPGQVTMDAYQYALDKDVVFVSAVGNSGKNDTKYYPGAYPGVIGVAATTDIDTWGTFSTYGDWVSLAAPGKGILSTYPTQKGNGYRIMDGTSMAAPLVSAAAALIRSEYPNFTQKQVKERLESTAKDVIMTGIDPYSGHGRIDVAKAILGE